MDTVLTHLNGATLAPGLLVVGITAVVLLVLLVLRSLLSAQLKRLSEKAKSDIWPVMQAIVQRTHLLFMLIVALFTGLLVLDIPQNIREVMQSVITIALLVQIGLWLGIALHVSVERYHQRKMLEDPSEVTTLSLLKFFGRVVIWSLVLLLILDNIGVNITTLIAGLGVGGIAVALALQTVLGDLFASLSIVLDKPFEVGDFLIVDDLLGSVEFVGLKTTRLRSLSGEQLVFSNSDLLNSRIRNFGRMYERRVVFKIGVTYQTPRDKLIKIPAIIRKAVEQQDNTRFDRSHFFEYGDFSLNYESVYYVKGPDYNQYMDIQQAINLYIHEQFENEGIEFAYPTQTLFMNRTN
ncbi:MAG: mechanosensitive ion channel family protein [Gammaproteobacteria bacterium]|nr:mechanosensitive ion channel family protein [Gammaproteobacteria bacterium]